MNPPPPAAIGLGSNKSLDEIVPSATAASKATASLATSASTVRL